MGPWRSSRHARAHPRGPGRDEVAVVDALAGAGAAVGGRGGSRVSSFKSSGQCAAPCVPLDFFAVFRASSRSLNQIR